MSAATLLSPRRLRFTLAAAACSGLHSLCRRNPPIAFDTPVGNIGLVQDASLIAYGRQVQRQFVHTESSERASQGGDAADAAELIDRTNEPDTVAPSLEQDDETSWTSFSRQFRNVKERMAKIQWTGMGDKITDFVMPTWARLIPDRIQKLQVELSMQPGSLADEIWQEAHDPEINPEIRWDARVRVGDTLCEEELAFRHKRKRRVVKALAKYLGIDEKDIHPEDVPTIAISSSGGGLRAMVAGTSSYLSAQEAGLFDCVTYTAGVSGSCWLQTLYYSSLGKQDHQTLLNHIKSRIGTHIAFPPAALKLATSAPTNKFILSGFVEKMKGDPKASFGLVDIYSLLLAARLLVPKGDLDVHDVDLKLSNQRMYIENGEHPMPIYTVVRHEIPDQKEEEQAKDNVAVKENTKERARKEAWFQWIELHPWEVWCEEFGAGIPTWSLGRPFNQGRNELVEAGMALPEIRQSLLLGIYGSAFCATLAHYYKEIKPILSGLTLFSSLDELMEEKNDDLIKIHPIDPATIPNFVYGMKEQLPSTCPGEVFEHKHLQLMDAGMSNNLPIYPLLRPGRDVDILIAFDASAHIQRENWLSVVDGYAKQRGIKAWPMGTGWPTPSAKPQEDAQVLAEAQATNPQEAAGKLAEAREQSRQERKTTEPIGLDVPESPTTGTERPNTESGLGPCTIWVGTTAERSMGKEPPASKRLAWDNPEESTFHLMNPDAGMTVIYFPLLPNPKVEGVDPDKTDYLSTWNFIYTPEQVDKVGLLARANFQEGEDATKRTVRAVYERKKKMRLEREGKSTVETWKKKLKDRRDTFPGS